MRDLAGAMLPVWIRGTEAHLDELTRRFERAPKPMYYPEEFLARLWSDWLAEHGVDAGSVDPDAFVRHGFRALMPHRLPRYRAIAERWGVTVEAAEVEGLRDPQDFEALVAAALARDVTGRWARTTGTTMRTGTGTSTGTPGRSEPRRS